MRRIRSIVYVIAASAVLCGSLAPAAFAGKLDDCHKPPPAWFTAPLRTYSTTYHYGAGYGRAASHEYSAQRRSYSYHPRYYNSHSRSSTSPSRRYRDPFARW